tara:strand:+ start:8537 stop:9115 length:579 start_codon:yes stop_codon:yes gene_type:complete
MDKYISVLEALIIVISICVLWTDIYMEDWVSVMIFIATITLCHYVLKFPVFVAFALAGILASISNLCGSRGQIEENYKEKKDIEDDDDDDEEEDEDVPSLESLTKGNVIDKTSTLMNTIKNIDPKTIKEMTQDTTSLLKSQTELMSTIEKLTPVIEQGMNLMDKFNGKKNSTKDLFEKFDKAKKLVGKKRKN